MVHRKGLMGAVIGTMLITGAGALGFAAGNWLIAIIVGGVGTTVFVAGIQYDGQDGL